MSLSIQTILFPPRKPPPSPHPSLVSSDFTFTSKTSSKASSANRFDTSAPARVMKESFDRLKDQCQEKLLGAVLNNVSVQSDELLLGEEMWRQRGAQVTNAITGMTSSARSKSVKKGTPHPRQASEWTQEKEFWLGYIPQSHRIGQYKTSVGASKEFWAPEERQVEGDQEAFHLQMQTDARTGERVPFSTRCKRYQKQLQYEQKVVENYDRSNGNGPKRWYGKTARAKEKALTCTLNRYKTFSAKLLTNLKEVQLNTKRLGEGQSLEKRRQIEQLERITDGYRNLKWIYDLNPELVEDLAQYHLKGPPGKRWMNLSRMEVQEVLTLLNESKEDPDFCPYVCLNAASKTNYNQQQWGSGGDMGDSGCGAKGNETYVTPIVPIIHYDRDRPMSTFSIGKKMPKGPRSARPPKPSQLMPIHVPGPDCLHQNVLIRAYTMEMDGHPESIHSLDQEQFLCPEIRVPKCKDDDGNTEEEEGEGEDLVIESFAPFYRS